MANHKGHLAQFIQSLYRVSGCITYTREMNPVSGLMRATVTISPPSQTPLVFQAEIEGVTQVTEQDAARVAITYLLEHPPEATTTKATPQVTGGKSPKSVLNEYLLIAYGNPTLVSFKTYPRGAGFVCTATLRLPGQIVRVFESDPATVFTTKRTAESSAAQAVVNFVQDSASETEVHTRTRRTPAPEPSGPELLARAPSRSRSRHGTRTHSRSHSRSASYDAKWQLPKDALFSLQKLDRGQLADVEARMGPLITAVHPSLLGDHPDLEPSSDETNSSPSCRALVALYMFCLRPDADVEALPVHLKIRAMLREVVGWGDMNPTATRVDDEPSSEAERWKVRLSDADIRNRAAALVAALNAVKEAITLYRPTTEPKELATRTHNETIAALLYGEAFGVGCSVYLDGRPLIGPKARAIGTAVARTVIRRMYNDGEVFVHTGRRYLDPAQKLSASDEHAPSGASVASDNTRAGPSPGVATSEPRDEYMYSAIFPIDKAVIMRSMTVAADTIPILIPPVLPHVGDVAPRAISYTALLDGNDTTELRGRGPVRCTLTVGSVTNRATFPLAIRRLVSSWRNAPTDATPPPFGRITRFFDDTWTLCEWMLFPICMNAVQSTGQTQALPTYLVPPWGSALAGAADVNKTYSTPLMR